MSSVTAYVDGFNLYFGVRAKFGHRYLWLDLLRLAQCLRPDDDIVAVRYFTAVVKGEPDAAQRQSVYLQALQHHCGAAMDIRRGWFKTRQPSACRRCGEPWTCGCPRRYRTYEEKETDVALAASIVEDTATGKSDVGLIVTADSDIAPVAAAKRVDPERSLILAMPPGNLKPHRRFENVGFFNINETHLRNSLLPDVVAGGYVRPQKWRGP